MKPWFLLILLSVAALAVSAGDVRTVGGRSVDLQPIHDWKVDKKGERPLPHWKDVLVHEVLDRPGGWDRCKVQIEGKYREILVANLPTSVRTFLQTFSQRLNAIEALRAQLAADRVAAQEAGNRWLFTTSGYASVRAGTSGVYVDNEDTRLARMLELQRRVDTEAKQLAALEAEHALAVEKAGESLTVLAMFTGKSYAKLEVWDTGLRR